MRIKKFGRLSGRPIFLLGGGRDRRGAAAVSVEVLAGKFGPAGPAARSRPPAEGCSSTSQARPLGCGLAWAYAPIRDTACEGLARVDLRDASCGPPPGRRAALLRRGPVRSAAGLLGHTSRFGAAACEAPARADAKADAGSGPSPGEAAARCGSSRSRKFKIQNSRFKIRWGCGHVWAYIIIRTAACGGLTRADLRDASCGPPPPPGCGPHGLFKAEIQHDLRFLVKWLPANSVRQDRFHRHPFPPPTDN